MFTTIDKMKRCIRTTYGDSTQTYKADKRKFHGILQGNGAGPTIWAMISSPMLDRLRHKGYVVKIKTDTSTEITIPGFAFVDDVDLIQELKGDDDVTSPQEAVTEWDDSLGSTGGMLVHKKSKFAIVHFAWKNNNWEMCKGTDNRIKIKIVDDEGKDHYLLQNVHSTGELALGIKFSPSGDSTDEIAHLRSKTEEWAEKV
jgi:hypothetical protein